MCFFCRERCCGLGIWFILRFLCSGFKSESLTISRCSFVAVLHSFLSLASLPIRLSPTRGIGGFSCMGIGMSCLVGCIGHILVAMSRYSWRSAMTWAAAEFIWSVVVVSLMSIVVVVCTVS